MRSYEFDESGKYVLSSSKHLSVRLWDVHRHTVIASDVGDSHAITSAAFSPSSALVACASTDSCIHLWSISTGVVVTTLAGHWHATPSCISWSSNEMLVAAGDCDGRVIVWETASARKRASLMCPGPAAISKIIIPPVGSFVAAAVVASSCIYVFDMDSASLLASCAQRCSVEHVHWRADGQVLQDEHGDLWGMP
jgi:WD40 repeat protein